MNEKICPLCKQNHLVIRMFKWSGEYPAKNVELKGMDFCNGCYYELSTTKNKYKLNELGEIVRNNVTY